MPIGTLINTIIQGKEMCAYAVGRVNAFVKKISSTEFAVGLAEDDVYLYKVVDTEHMINFVKTMETH